MFARYNDITTPPSPYLFAEPKLPPHWHPVAQSKSPQATPRELSQPHPQNYLNPSRTLSAPADQPSPSHKRFVSLIRGRGVAGGENGAQDRGSVVLIIQIQTVLPSNYMSSKKGYIKTNNASQAVEGGAAGGEGLWPPCTPVKKHPSELLSNFYLTLSPLVIPPKPEHAHHYPPSSYFDDMRIVETPLPKDPLKLLPGDHEHNDGINGRIIFESEAEDPPYESSANESDDSQEEESEDPPTEEKKEESEEQSPSGEVDSDKENESEEEDKPRRVSKPRGAVSNPLVGSGKKIFCNCKKTKCLKLYCDCFRLNQTCEGCNCQGCHNLQVYSEERNNAILALMDRNPDPFGQKIEADKHLKGCNCKKSNCLKKYCECYQAGLKCGDNCKCQECKNCPAPDPPARSTAKKQRRMVEI